VEWKEENIYFTETCSGSEVGSYLRLIDCVYHSTLGLRVGKKKKKEGPHENSRRNLKQRPSQRLPDFVDHSTLGLKVIKTKQKEGPYENSRRKLGS
jgi:hypothetical protein